MTSAPIIGILLLAFAFSRVPDEYKPAWTRRLHSWQMWLGLVAFLLALVIILNPEFYALGLLGDSAFFDLLVFAIGLQLQSAGSRIWQAVAPAISRLKRFVVWRLYASQLGLVLLGSLAITIFIGIFSIVQKVAQRISS